MGKSSDLPWIGEKGLTAANGLQLLIADGPRSAPLKSATGTGTNGRFLVLRSAAQRERLTWGRELPSGNAPHSGHSEADIERP